MKYTSNGEKVVYSYNEVDSIVFRDKEETNPGTEPVEKVFVDLGSSVQ